MDFFFLKLYFLTSCLQGINSLMSNCYVAPHGGIALDPRYFNTTNATALKEAWAIHSAYIDVGEEIEKIGPDLVLISTPHGIADLNDFVFYFNPTASGYADTDSCLCPPCCYNATVNLSTKVTSDLVNLLRQSQNVSALSGFGPPGRSDSPFPLRWGEVIPLHFLQRLSKSTSEFIILSQPSRRYASDVLMIPELLKLGSELYHYFDSIPQKVVVLISADLAHTHSKDGPYGFSEAAKPFDEAIGNWAKYREGSYLLDTAASYVDKALSCGFTGLVMLQGMLDTAGMTSWGSDVMANYHPSYYGMMVAAFRKDDRTEMNSIW